MTPVVSSKGCTARKVAEVAIKSAARRRGRKSRGEQDENSSSSTTQRVRVDIFRMREREILLILDCKQKRASARRERIGGDLTFEAGRPSARNRGGAMRTTAIRCEAIVFDQVAVALDHS